MLDFWTVSDRSSLMSDIDLFESRFEAWIRARADRAVRPTDAAAIARSALMAAGRPGRWRGFAGGAGVLRPAPSLARLLLVVLLVALLATVGVLVGSQLLRPAPTTPPQRGAFTPAGTLDEALEPGLFTATGLPDGRVLVIGGCGSCAVAQLSEVACGEVPNGPSELSSRMYSGKKPARGSPLSRANS